MIFTDLTSCGSDLRRVVFFFFFNCHLLLLSIGRLGLVFIFFTVVSVFQLIFVRLPSIPRKISAVNPTYFSALVLLHKTTGFYLSSNSHIHVMPSSTIFDIFINPKDEFYHTFGLAKESRLVIRIIDHHNRNILARTVTR